MTTATIENVEILDTTPVRDQVAAEIITLLNDIGSNYLKIGALLAEGKEDFDNQRDFLEWADDTFGIKKAQCYNLMNISRVFATRKEFSGVAMRVLLMLVPFADDGELMDKAADMAAVGELDTAAANQLLGKPAKGAVSPALAAVKQAMVAQQATQEEVDKVEVDSPVSVAARKHQTYTVPSLNSGDSGVPFDTEEAPAPTVAPAVPDAIQEGLLSELKKLREDNAALHARIMELTATRETKKASAPMLPQFKSKCMYARLGLSVEQSMSLSAVNKAKRELVKLGYGAGHEAWAYIEDAVNALITTKED